MPTAANVHLMAFLEFTGPPTLTWAAIVVVGVEMIGWWVKMDEFRLDDSWRREISDIFFYVKLCETLSKNFQSLVVTFRNMV